MSNLLRIDEDLKAAMKAGETRKLSVLRILKSTLKNKEIDLKRPLNDMEFIAIVNSMVKARVEAIEQYEKAEILDRIAEEKAEIDFLSLYLPQALTTDELDVLIRGVIAKIGAAGPADMGRVMKELKEPTAGRVDGKVLSDRVKALLAG